MHYLRHNQVIHAGKQAVDTGVYAYHHRLSSRGKFLGDFSYTRWANDAIQKFAEGKPIPTWKDESIGGYCERYTHGMYSGEIRSNRGSKYSENSIKTYANAASCLFKFGKRLSLSAGRREYREYFHAFEGWMESEGYNTKTRAEVVNAIFIMVRYWCREKDLPSPEPHRMAKSDKPIVVVPPEAISVVVNSDRFLGTELQPVWEVACTILLTTLRLSDIVSLKPEHFTMESGRMAITKVTQKTGALVSIPVPGRMSEIFRQNLTNGSPWSGPVDEAIIHAKLRSIFEPFREVQQDYTAGGETKPLWQWVTPHMLRKSAITGLIYYGVDHLSVRHASGHSHGSTAFWRYVKVVESRFKSEISSGHEAMLKTISATPELSA